MTTASCRHCTYGPVGTGAPVCPRCGGAYPNLNIVREVLVGLLVVGLIVVVIALVKFVGPDLVGMAEKG